MLYHFYRKEQTKFEKLGNIISGSEGQMYDFATGSYFAPYVTTVGLYDESYNLLAVAKLAKPLPTSRTTDTTILINFDK